MTFTLLCKSIQNYFSSFLRSSTHQQYGQCSKAKQNKAKPLLFVKAGCVCGSHTAYVGLRHYCLCPQKDGPRKDGQLSWLLACGWWHRRRGFEATRVDFVRCEALRLIYSATKGRAVKLGTAESE